MNVKIEPLPTFKREAKRLNKHYASFADDYEKLIAELENNPHLDGYHFERERQERRRTGYFFYRSGGGGGDRNQLALHLRQGGAFFYQQERNRRTASAERTEMT